jgi:hypothetical protein
MDGSRGNSGRQARYANQQGRGSGTVGHPKSAVHQLGGETQQSQNDEASHLTVPPHPKFPSFLSS